jgi:SAM-dependent methyltransferase
MSYEGPDTQESITERRRVAAGELPERYAEPWGRPFFEAAKPALRDGASVLDVGAGRSPVLPPAARPPSCEYVGLDVSASELAAAGPGSYDECITGDISVCQDDLAGRFDLLLSWQVLEHVASTAAALENMRAYLKPGGRMVAQLSGRYAVFSLLARAIPYRTSQYLMKRLLGADPETKFPTRYDACHERALERLLQPWESHGVVPRYKGAGYFRFSRMLERTYLTYENWIARSGRSELATHYVVWAVK